MPMDYPFSFQLIKACEAVRAACLWLHIKAVFPWDPIHVPSSEYTDSLVYLLFFLRSYASPFFFLMFRTRLIGQ